MYVKRKFAFYFVQMRKVQAIKDGYPVFNSQNNKGEPHG